VVSNLFMRTKIIFGFLAVILVLIHTAITETKEISVDEALEFRKQTLDDSKLYWCIDLINVSKIKRGTSKNELVQLFGDSLEINDANSTARSVLTTKSKGYTGPPFQAPSPWVIKFTFDKEGKVQDYCINRPAGK
jgi:hypothetical protein